MIAKIKRLLSDKDERNLFKNILLAFVVKGLSLIVSFFSMPLYIKYFANNEVLGVWYTVLSLLTWINICDLGLGNGLRNRLTENLSVGNREMAKRNVSSTYVLLAVVIVPVAIVGSIVLCFLDLNTFFGVAESIISADSLRLSIIIMFVGVAVSFVLKTINSVIYAIQKSSYNNVLSLIASILPLLFILVYNGTSVSENFVAMSIVHAVAINLPLLVATVVLFSSKLLRDVKPSIKHFSFETAKGVVGFGLKFFFAQVFFMLLMSTNEIMITRMVSAEAVVDYSIYHRLFTLVGSLFTLALTPLWSKVTSDLAQKKYYKIRKTNKVLYGLSGVAVLCEFLMIPLLNFIMSIWLGDEAIPVDYAVATVFAAFGGMYIVNVVLTTVANGIGNLKSQMVFYGIGAALKIPVSYLLMKIWNNWSVIVLYNLIVLIVFSVYQILWVERTLKKLDQNTEKPELVHQEV